MAACLLDVWLAHGEHAELPALCAAVETAVERSLGCGECTVLTLEHGRFLHAWGKGERHGSYRSSGAQGPHELTLGQAAAMYPPLGKLRLQALLREQAQAEEGLAALAEPSSSRQSKPARPSALPPVDLARSAALGMRTPNQVSAASAWRSNAILAAALVANAGAADDDDDATDATTDADSVVEADTGALCVALVSAEEGEDETGGELDAMSEEEGGSAQPRHGRLVGVLHVSCGGSRVGAAAEMLPAAREIALHVAPLVRRAQGITARRKLLPLQL